jgi:hypothetical protein
VISIKFYACDGANVKHATMSNAEKVNEGLLRNLRCSNGSVRGLQ